MNIKDYIKGPVRNTTFRDILDNDSNALLSQASLMDFTNRLIGKVETTAEVAEIYKQVGQFVADAINEKLERENYKEPIISMDSNGVIKSITTPK